jgi:hypothetical protein
MPRITLAFVLLTAVALSAQSPTVTVLPITRVVLYKSGIGFFEHLATVTGNQALAVQFTGDQLDDVLKSLTAVDLGNGRVSGISYDSPTPGERRLRALRVPLAPDATSIQLLQALRGARVEVRTGGGVATTGRVLQAERRTRVQGEGGAAEQDELTIVSDTGEIATLEIGHTTRVRIVDADLRQDVGRYLDIASTNSDRSQRRVVLSTVGTGARQVLVSYVGEAAVWKTTYRLVFPSTGERAPVLQGWALVDNVSAADWDNVELSLVAGAPQAFRQTLSAPLFVTRPLVPLAAASGLAPQLHAGALTGGSARLMGYVRDNGGAALPGVTITVLNQAGTAIGTAVSDGQGRYDIGGLPAGTASVRAQLTGFNLAQVPQLGFSPGQTQERDFTMSVGGLEETITVSAASPGVRSVPRPRAGEDATVSMNLSAGFVGGNLTSPAAPPPPGFVEDRMLSQSIAASGADLGDLFEYKLTDRVSIRRNQSALVPILQTTVTADKLSLWNDAMGGRPRRAVWLRNTSALTLDAGSLSIVDGGAFAGEGLIEPLKPNERRLVTYAGDLGVQVNARASDTPTRLVRLSAAKGVVTQQSEQRWRRVYTVRNDDRDARVVVIEHPVRAGWTLAPTAKPDESTATVHRFRVTVAAGQTTTLDVDEVRPGTTTIRVNELHRDRLRVLISGDEARGTVERAMEPVFAKSAELDAIEADMQRRSSELDSITSDQDRVRENIKALGNSSAERRLLERYTGQLEAQENRVDVLKRELAELGVRQAQAERELSALIAGLSFDVTP